MRRAVIAHQMDDLQACAQCTLKKLQQEGLEIGKLSPATCPRKRQPRSDQQGTEQLHCAHPFIPIRDVEGVPWRRCLGRTDTLAGLDGGLLITAHHRFTLRCQCLRVFVEIEGHVPIFPVRLPAEQGVKSPYVSTCSTDPLCSTTATGVWPLHSRDAKR